MKIESPYCFNFIDFGTNAETDILDLAIDCGKHASGLPFLLSVADLTDLVSYVWTKVGINLMNHANETSTALT